MTESEQTVNDHLCVIRYANARKTFFDYTAKWINGRF